MRASFCLTTPQPRGAVPVGNSHNDGSGAGENACFILETNVKGDSCFAIPTGKGAQDRRNLLVFKLYPFYNNSSTCILHVLHHRMCDLKLRVLPNLSPPE